MIFHLEIVCRNSRARSEEGWRREGWAVEFESEGHTEARLVGRLDMQYVVK